MAPVKAQPSAAFLNRELNGEVLLDELDELQQGRVPQRALNDCARELAAVKGSATQAAALIRALATNRFSRFPPLVSLLKRWATKLKTNSDVPLLAAHFDRLAVVAAVLSSLTLATRRLSGAGR